MAKAIQAYESESGAADFRQVFFPIHSFLVMRLVYNLFWWDRAPFKELVLHGKELLEPVCFLPYKGIVKLTHFNQAVCLL